MIVYYTEARNAVLNPTTRKGGTPMPGFRFRDKVERLMEAMSAYFTV